MDKGGGVRRRRQTRQFWGESVDFEQIPRCMIDDLQIGFTTTAVATSKPLVAVRNNNEWRHVFVTSTYMIQSAYCSCGNVKPLVAVRNNNEWRHVFVTSTYVIQSA